MSFGSNGSHRHQPTPLNLGRYSALSVRTREVKALYVMRLIGLYCISFFICLDYLILSISLFFPSFEKSIHPSCLFVCLFDLHFEGTTLFVNNLGLTLLLCQQFCTFIKLPLAFN